MGNGTAVNIHIVAVTEVATEILGSITTGRTSSSAIPLVANKVLCVHQIQCLGDVAQHQTAIETYLNLTGLGRLGSYNNYTVTTSCTIDSGQRGVLQDVNAGDIRWRNIVDVVSLEAVDDEQGAVLRGYRRCTTNADVDVSTRLTVGCRNLHTGNLTLQGFCC